MIKESYPKNLKFILSFIHENYRRAININELEKVGFCSKATIFRLFLKHLDTTPITYINQLKIQESKKMLKDTNREIQSISKHLGFSDPYYFSKLFHKEVGCSPSKYKHILIERAFALRVAN